MASSILRDRSLVMWIIPRKNTEVCLLKKNCWNFYRPVIWSALSNAVQLSSGQLLLAPNVYREIKIGFYWLLHICHHAYLCPCSPPPCSLSKPPIQDSVEVSFVGYRFQYGVFEIVCTLLFDCVNASNVNKHPLYSNRHWRCYTSSSVNMLIYN